MTTSPATRVANTLNHAQAFERWAVKSNADVERVVPVHVKQALDEMSRVGWMPIETHLDLIERAYTVLTRETFAAALHDVGTDLLDSALLRMFVQAAVGVSGMRPTALARWTPKGWSLVFREMGTLSVEPRGERAVAVVFDDMPAIVMRSPVWAEAMRAFMQSYAAATRHPGRAVTEVFDKAARRIVFVVEDGEPPATT